MQLPNGARSSSKVPSCYQSISKPQAATLFLREELRENNGPVVIPERSEMEEKGVSGLGVKNPPPPRLGQTARSPQSQEVFKSLKHVKKNYF
eukprot:2925895-Amphidinium_carterae.1